MNTEQLQLVLTAHKQWLADSSTGARANLSGAHLSYANLSGAHLSYANLSGAHLSYAYLSGANLRDANLRGANLSGANLSGAHLSYANLSGANLSGANLRGANLSGAYLWGCIGNRREIKSLEVAATYVITYTKDVLQIGCKRYPIAQWWEFSDNDIMAMDDEQALTFWKEWKDTLRMLIEKSPAI